MKINGLILLILVIGQMTSSFAQRTPVFDVNNVARNAGVCALLERNLDLPRLKVSCLRSFDHIQDIVRDESSYNWDLQPNQIIEIMQIPEFQSFMKDELGNMDSSRNLFDYARSYFPNESFALRAIALLFPKDFYGIYNDLNMNELRLARSEFNSLCVRRAPETLATLQEEICSGENRPELRRNFALSYHRDCYGPYANPTSPICTYINQSPRGLEFYPMSGQSCFKENMNARDCDTYRVFLQRVQRKIQNGWSPYPSDISNELSPEKFHIFYKAYHLASNIHTDESMSSFVAFSYIINEVRRAAQDNFIDRYYRFNNLPETLNFNFLMRKVPSFLEVAYLAYSGSRYNEGLDTLNVDEFMSKFYGNYHQFVRENLLDLVTE